MTSEQYERYVEVYRDTAGEWRWRVRAHNGEIVGDSGEGYRRRWYARRAARRAFPGLRCVEDEYLAGG
jgi:uncharacterized protein YegP (UPF0339 family)